MADDKNVTDGSNGKLILDDGHIKAMQEYLSPEELYNDLIERVRKYHPSDDISMIEKAYRIAYDAHKDQIRKSGEPYIIHPLCVAIILADLEMDKETIAAGLLHDVVEDTAITFDDLSSKGFSDNVITALRLLTHDKSVDYFEYVSLIKGNPIASAVKLADLKHNSDLSRLETITEKDGARKEKYEKAIQILCE